MFINRLSIPLSIDNIQLLYDLANREIVKMGWYYENEEEKIYIILDDEMNYKRLNNELKCLNVFYEVVSIVATDEEVHSDFNHLIDKNFIKN